MAYNGLIRSPYRDPKQELLIAIQECLAEWGDDPAYDKAAQKLREVDRELDVLIASPGHRAALRGPDTNQSGQEPRGEY